ncbi:MAG: 50S ribosomal protein L29 [Desulfuromonadales bacterium]|nr:50S ribosomal protein L29 [Desulfuromonadales bacterium]
MKPKDLRNMSIEDLKSKKGELVQELFNLKFQLHTGRLENTAKLKTIRQGIAQVNTILTENRA